jgi:hypothetical protein
MQQPELCIECNKEPIAVKKRKLCKRCYARFLSHHGPIKVMPISRQSIQKRKTEREMEFIKNYFINHNWLYEPASFKLYENDMYYTPDFYDNENNVFIEVVGSRQAYHQNKKKYAEFKKLFPKIGFEIRTPNGELLDEDNDRLNWENTGVNN